MAQQAVLTVINGPIISAGESLSSGIDCSSGDVVRITMPTDWTPANLTFQISTDGAFYNDMFDAYGEEVTIVVTKGAAVRIDKEWSNFWNFVKFRSGTRSHPVKQQTQRDFAVTVRLPNVVASAESPARQTPTPQRPVAGR